MILSVRCASTYASITGNVVPVVQRGALNVPPPTNVVGIDSQNRHHLQVQLHSMRI